MNDDQLEQEWEKFEEEVIKKHSSNSFFLIPAIRSKNVRTVRLLLWLMEDDSMIKKIPGQNRHQGGATMSQNYIG